jgi:hypothetical protein
MQTTAREYWGRMPTEVASALLTALRELEAEGRYPALVPLIQLLQGDARHPHANPRLTSRLVDPRAGGVTVRRVHDYLVAHLPEMRPEPLVRVDRTAVEFFGARFVEKDLAGICWHLLRVLCQHPAQTLSREQIIRTGRLSCDPAGLPPHVTRLRQRLEPAIKSYFQRRPRPDAADGSCIAGVRGPDGGYKLDVAEELVQVIERG